MESAESPPVVIVVAQTGVGSAFSAGAPIESPKPSQPSSAGAQAASGTSAAAAGAPSAVPAADPRAASGDDDDEWGEVDEASTEADAAPPETLGAPPGLLWQSYAAHEYRPRGPFELDLCTRAASTDYLYVAGMFAATAGLVVLDSQLAKHADSAALRLTGAGAVGLGWGALLGGTYLSLPKCAPNFVSPVPPEGSTEKRWPLAIAIATAAAISAPFLVFIETGKVPTHWSVGERTTRIFVPAATGFLGALLPWIPQLAPRTYRNALKLERIRLQGAPIPPGAHSAPPGFWIGYNDSF